MKEKVVLAYSGGLDTTAIIPWLKENYDYDVVCCCIDCRSGTMNWTVWKREQSFPALREVIHSRMSSMSSAMIILFPAFRLMPYMRTSTCWVPPWLVR